MNKIIKWTARIISIVIVSLILLFFVAHAVGNLTGMDDSLLGLSLSTYIGFTLIGVMCIGLILAWKWELIGGILTIAGYCGFITIAPNGKTAWPFLVFVICGLLFILAGIQNRLETRKMGMA